MATYYPPIIEGKLPAQTGDTLRIPFEHSIANTASTMAVKIKTVATNRLLGTYIGKINNKFVNVSDSRLTLTIGQHYKVQLAYCELDANGGITNEGYYSSVGVFKYTAQPNIYINGLNADAINAEVFSYIGVYDQTQSTASGAPLRDPTEKVYKYEFNIYEDGELYESSGELLHNTIEDDSLTISKDVFTPRLALRENHMYQVVYKVITLNDLTVSSQPYALMKIPGVKPDIVPEIYIADKNFDNGYFAINVSVKPELQGQYELSRKSNDGPWERLGVFTIDAAEEKEVEIFRDYTIQHGVFYQYALRQVDTDLNIYSEYITNDKSQEKCDLYDAFLFDGQKQLKIKFDPKISSFKNTILEQKTDTIGGQYPFFYRNARVRYKEFPISGLISYHMDENELFMTDEELGFVSDNNVCTNTKGTAADASVRTTNLTRDNINAERIFRLAVLDWLTDGKPKLFRSSTEGNYIIRLMNVSLQPNDTLGRLLYNFSCTAYEIAPYDNLTLMSLGLVGNIINILDRPVIRQYELSANETFIFDAPTQRLAITTANRNNTALNIMLTYEDGYVQSMTMPPSGVYIIDTPIEMITATNSCILDYIILNAVHYPILVSGQPVRSNTIVHEYRTAQNGELDLLDVTNILYVKITSNPNSDSTNYTYTLTFANTTEKTATLSRIDDGNGGIYYTSHLYGAGELEPCKITFTPEALNIEAYVVKHEVK